MQRTVLENFARRVAALAELELYLAGSRGDAAARTRAGERSERLEARNARASLRLAQRIAAKRYTRAGLRRVFSAETAGAHGTELKTSYDWRDTLLDGLLSADEVAPERLEPEPELVFYQPTPARVIAALIDQTQLGPSDTLCDLGSGLGHVIILASLLTGARTLGIERELAYCEHARSSVRRLALDSVQLACGDARELNYGASNVFFLYTPFRGRALQQVLRRLEALAGTRSLRVASYGPCTLELAREAWLVRREDVSPSPRELAVFTAAAR